MLTTVMLGLQISQDRAFTSIVAAGRLDGDVIGAELLAYLPGTDAVADVLRVRTERTVQAVVVDGHSPGATLIQPLRDVGIEVIEPSASDLVVAHGLVLDRIGAKTLLIRSHPALDAAARYATQRPLSGAQFWERRGAPVDIGPLDAMTVAVWAVTARPVQPFFATVRVREDW
jgi:hypothetical protein